jgi:hypothetical protein
MAFKASSQGQADHAIHVRRARESALEDLSSHLNNDYKLRHKAQWEAKTDNMITQGRIRRRANELKQVHDETIQSRRQKLKAQYEAEQAQFQLEFIQNQEKPEDIRNRMAERLFELKSKREDERKNMVDSLYEKRWKDNADELRSEGSKLSNLESRIEMKNQMRFKKDREDQ